MILRAISRHISRVDKVLRAVGETSCDKSPRVRVIQVDKVFAVSWKLVSAFGTVSKHESGLRTKLELSEADIYLIQLYEKIQNVINKVCCHFSINKTLIFIVDILTFQIASVWF